MNEKIRKGYETEIVSYMLELTCKCGGKMHYTMKSIDGYHISMSVKCEKCAKLSNVELRFNNYEVFE